MIAQGGIAVAAGVYLLDRTAEISAEAERARQDAGRLEHQADREEAEDDRDRDSGSSGGSGSTPGGHTEPVIGPDGSRSGDGSGVCGLRYLGVTGWSLAELDAHERGVVDTDCDDPVTSPATSKRTDGGGPVEVSCDRRDEPEHTQDPSEHPSLDPSELLPGLAGCDGPEPGALCEPDRGGASGGPNDAGSLADRVGIALCPERSCIPSDRP